MPSLITHSVVAAAAGAAVGRSVPVRFWVLSVFCAVLPDADVIGFSLGIRYGDVLGHRGFFHSLFFALLLGLFVTAVFFRSEPYRSRQWSFFAPYFVLLTASHGILDAFTSGGLGIALLSPFDTTRYFFPWTPVRVSPIGIKAFFGPWGARVMVSEILWIWLPALGALLLLKAPALFRKVAATRRK
ncbi:MAG: hypothetical protein A2X56_03895 [Nitrospirae bacterium GWC2_57_13]|jgi:inner membrane protein|nr:MAG: hypothetical protein A2072_01375 [Nitrospirae bacterium GWC1_57_7]OGW27377.1 MAG: hypothetical protein A2X56_03895 [Nitrospirae bacterium GWC2_57_13]OGW43792.1 MAG: hypothetical protein A2X57_00405 [Nitrospirae bacterium GWD2_57_8]HAR45497.1 metal-dependent hydrolase [Nitrospiraceae bacterium]